jgi:hypothetical protein
MNELKLIQTMPAGRSISHYFFDFYDIRHDHRFV